MPDEAVDMRQGKGVDPDCDLNFGKGSWRRNMNETLYAKNFDRIFKKNKKKLPDNKE